MNRFFLSFFSLHLEHWLYIKESVYRNRFIRKLKRKVVLPMELQTDRKNEMEWHDIVLILVPQMSYSLFYRPIFLHVSASVNKQVFCVLIFDEMAWHLAKAVVDKKKSAIDRNVIIVCCYCISRREALQMIQCLESYLNC